MLRFIMGPLGGHAQEQGQPRSVSGRSDTVSATSSQTGAQQGPNPAPVTPGGGIRLRHTFYDFERKFPQERFQYDDRLKRRHGSYESYYLGGGVKSRGHYAQGELAGFWSFYFENGNQKAQGIYEADQKTGVWTYYFESGAPSQKGSYVADKRRGHWQFFYEAGGLKSEGTLINERNEGRWIYYAEDGAIKATGLYKQGRGLYREVYPVGGIRMEGIIDGNKSDSVWTYYYETGEVKARGRERNGLREGEWTYYHPDGSLLSKGAYRSDQEEGAWAYYHPNGQLSSEGTFSEGQKEGRWLLYYESGKFMAEGAFDHGKGTYTEYYDDGKLKLKGRIEKQRHVGRWEFFYPDGTLEGVCEYVNGEGDYQGYYPDGSRKVSGRLRNGQKTGVWRLYTPEGNLAGLHKTYYEVESVVPGTQMYSTPGHASAPSRNIFPTQARFIAPSRPSRFYQKRVNEMTGWIVSANPLALLLNQVPVYVEYQWLGRLGFEGLMQLYRSPLIGNHEQILQAEPNRLLNRELTIGGRQRLYFEDRFPGLSWIGQEIRVTHRQLGLLETMSMSDGTQRRIRHQNSEISLEGSLLVGKRFYRQERHRPTFTWDLFAGVGAGYCWPLGAAAPRAVYGTYGRPRFVLLPRLGASIGYLF